MSGIATVRFEPPAGFQTSGGPGWSTQIVTLASGREARNALWSAPLRRWQVAGVPLNKTGVDSLTRFFNARSGRQQGFCFRDPFAFSSAAAGMAISPEDQFLGTGDGETQTFQLVLDDGGSVPRVITRPVAESVRVALDGIETLAFSVDAETGLVSFDSPPDVGVGLTAGFEFDVPVRFDSDTMEMLQPSPGTFQLVRLGLLEVREG